MRAQVLTPWIGDGSSRETGHRPQLEADYALASWDDKTHQPTENLTPDPNLFVIEIECDGATLAAIEADSNYVVLWSEDDE